MKGFALVLLCIVAAVQGRSTAVQGSERSLAALGENPWLVHIRLAVGSSGYLNSCAGSLIGSSWVLTSNGCVDDSKFIWLRYGVVNVINPSLVTESTTVIRNPSDDVALVGINRVVESTDNIAPIALSSLPVPESATFCAWGATESGAAGESLSCFVIALSEDNGEIVAQSDDGETTKYDIGAPLVSDGQQIGILTRWANDDNAGTFISAAQYIDWIESSTGLSLRK